MTTAFTREMLRKSLAVKTGAPWHEGEVTARGIGDAITSHGLLDVIAGCHDGKPVTFARGFELVYGERLTLDGGRKRA